MLYQISAIPIVIIKHRFNLPDVNTYKSSISYSLPFKNEWTVVNGGVEKEFSYSWNIHSQRYAYDFLILDKKGKSFSGDFKDLEAYYCYGKDVLAPADGMIVKIKINHKESKIFRFNRTDRTIKDIRGNYIVIQHDKKEYSVLAHLIPQSINVKVGQSVKRGEVIAKCGNSGNSTEPHLHFQMQDGKSFFYSMGLPIKFTDIHVTDTPSYTKYDDRTLPNNIDKDSGFLQRGSTVKNII